MTSWNIDFYAIDQSRETCTDSDTLYEYTSCIWPSFVYHSPFMICDFWVMLCSRSLLRTVLELIGRNPGMLLAVRRDVWNRFIRCTSLMWLSWRRDVPHGRPEPSWNIDFYAIDQSRETCTDFDTLYEYTSCIWPSCVYHSRLTICDCLRFTKVCFCHYTSEKTALFEWH
jgi:hypothetical protein